MAALRIHQHHGIDQMHGSAFPFPPLAFRAARQIWSVAALEHYPFDRLGIFPGPGASGIFSRGGKRVPAIEWNRRRQIDSDVIELADKGLEPGAAFDKGQRAQIGVAVAEQVVGAQMDLGYSFSSLGETTLRLRRCCSTLKVCTRPLRITSNSPSMAPGRRSDGTQIGKAFW